MLTYTLYALFILASLILIVVVLLQPGKADAGALFSNTLSSTAFGPRGTASLLAKITIGGAVAFMLLALALGLSSVTGSRSVLSSAPSSAPSATPTPSPAAPVSLPVAPVASPSTAPAASPSASAKTSPATAPKTSPSTTASPGKK